MTNSMMCVNLWKKFCFSLFSGVLASAVVLFDPALAEELASKGIEETSRHLSDLSQSGNRWKNRSEDDESSPTHATQVDQTGIYPSTWDATAGEESVTSPKSWISEGPDMDYLEKLAENASQSGYDDGELPLKYTLITLAYALIVLVSLVGNLFVVLVIISKKRTRTTVNIFIANLAVSDLLMTVLNIPFTATRLIMPNWIFGSFLCHVSPFIQATSVYVSTLTMCFIAVDRFQAILQPMRRRFSSRIPPSVAIALIWMIAMLFSLPFLLFNRIQVEGLFQKMVRCKVVYPEPAELYQKSVNIVTFILQFGIPFTIMVSLYSRIGVKIWSRTTIGATTREQEYRQFNAKKRTIIMLLLVAIVFAFCWFPHNLYHFLVDFKYWANDWNTKICTHWLAMSSVCYNPFIYFWLNRRFQQILRSGMQRFCSHCYCHHDSTGCSCLGITCFCHKMTTAKMVHVSSPTSESSPRVQANNNAANCARGGQAYLLHHNNWREERNGVRKLRDSTAEKDTGFNDPGLPAQETLSQYMPEDSIHSPKTKGYLSNAGSSGGSGNSSEASAVRDARGRDENPISLSSGSTGRRKARYRKKIRYEEKDLNTVSSSIESKNLFRNRNLHQQEQGQSRNRNPMTWNQLKLNNITRRIFMDSSKNSLSSSSSVGSGLDHQKHLICHYRGIRRPVHGNCPAMYQTRCGHQSVSRCVRKSPSGDHSVVLASL